MSLLPPIGDSGRAQRNDQRHSWQARLALHGDGCDGVEPDGSCPRLWPGRHPEPSWLARPRPRLSTSVASSAQPNWTYLTNTHDRCADGNYHQFIYTRTHLVESGNYACAIVKEYPDGTGHNDTAPQCAQVFGTYPYMYIESPCTTPYSCTGYATITNDDVYAGHYWGFASI
jgi:hypothetical protein